ncbi:DUF2017 family protein [Leucobacter weissii]|uniref:DUF2017 family protein n=1 Tax=Leucobacter weissii TaxID=1983706 RepID=A0A939MHT9_9MICO|nr:DUF2017 family protein [Leucobacter weissii]MBO1901203.1 DUF2017 family protein [Leucobacter weissii]
MRMIPLQEGGLRLRLDFDEAHLLGQLTGQLIDLLRDHSGTALDPDPLFASLEVGGSEQLPGDPALARLFPDAYEAAESSAQFRRVTEQGLLNRKLQDALEVSGAIGLGAVPAPDAEPSPVEIEISPANLPAWVRTLTALRLAIAARIGLNAESDHARLLADDEKRGTVLVYDWLAAIIDSMLRMGDEG